MNDKPDNIDFPPPVKKKPRKPRPSEIAAKKAKAKKKAVKKSKPKAKRKPGKPKSPKTSAAVYERLDLRVSRKLKLKLMAKVKSSRRTITSIISELLEKMR